MMCAPEYDTTMRRAAVLISLVAMLNVGCRPTATETTKSSEVALPSGQEISDGMHACADQMHEIAGAILLYYSTNHRMPATLEELGKSPGGESIGEAKCPVSGTKYAYEPQGVIGPGGSSHVVVYDVNAVHGGLRLGISVSVPKSGALVTKVVALPKGWTPVTLLEQPDLHPGSVSDR